MILQIPSPLPEDSPLFSAFKRWSERGLFYEDEQDLAAIQSHLPVWDGFWKQLQSEGVSRIPPLWKVSPFALVSPGVHRVFEHEGQAVRVVVALGNSGWFFTFVWEGSPYIQWARPSASDFEDVISFVEHLLCATTH